jgi:Fe-S-cluster containining protein
VFEAAWQNELTTAAANTAYAVLEGQPTIERTIELARRIMAAMSRMAEGLLARAPEGSVACRAGCDHCCHQVVGVTVPEALAILDHLARTWTSADRARLTERVSLLHERAQGVSSVERFSPNHPCVFLDGGRCSIYEVRPLACRGMNSLDAAECESRLRDPQARAAFVANGFGGRSFLEPIRAFHAISAGLQLSLSELHGLDLRPLDLTAAMHLLLGASEPLIREWLAGGAPFESARRSDETKDAAHRELSGAL